MPLWSWVIPALCVAALVLLLQVISGTYTAELSGYPDEPAHHITGLMFDRYAREGAPVSPAQYAREFYLRYPKVAIGHWPPVLYILQSCATLIAKPRREVYLSLSAISTIAFAVLFLHETTRRAGLLTAFLLTLVLVCTPEMQRQTAMVMADVLVALAIYVACRFLVCLLRSPDRTSGVLFGVATVAAILTKGTGWLIPGVFVAAVFVLRQYNLFRNRNVWLGIGVILIVCVPWQLATLKLVMPGWGQNRPDIEFFIRSLFDTFRLTVSMVGIPVAILAAIGMYREIAGRWHNRSITPFAAVSVSVVAVTFLFHAMVPTLVELRKILFLLPPLLAFAATGAIHISSRLAAHVPLLCKPAAVIAFAVGAFFLTGFNIPRKQSFGFRETAKYLSSSPAESAILVSSRFDGEGLLISEFGFLEPQPRHYLVRASKVLATGDWSGRIYRSRVHSSEEAAAVLNQIPASFVVIDTRPGIKREHHDYLVQAVRNRGWSLVAKFPERALEPVVLVYQANRPLAPVRRLNLDMTLILGTTLTLER